MEKEPIADINIVDVSAKRNFKKYYITNINSRYDMPVIFCLKIDIKKPRLFLFN